MSDPENSNQELSNDTNNSDITYPEVVEVALDLGYVIVEEYEYENVQ